MIKYKIVLFHCGCKYIWTPDITLKPAKCPIHGKIQKSIILWCNKCGVKMEVIPLAGQKIRCYECSKYKIKKTNRMKQREIAAKKPTEETLRMRDFWCVERWFQELRDLKNWKIPRGVVV